MKTLKSQLAALGVASNSAKSIADQINKNLKKFTPEECWQKIIKEILPANYSFDVHLLLYKSIFSNWDHAPSPAWFPNDHIIQIAHITQLMQKKGFKNFKEFHHWSATHPEDFWQMMVKTLQIVFDSSYTSIVDLHEGSEQPKWFPNAKLNIAISCFQSKPTDIAVIYKSERGNIIKISYDALNKLSNRIANSLSKKNKGDNIGIIMPMTYEAVAIYLGIIKAGCAVASIPDSFSADEIAKRLRIADVKTVFCQDQIIRDGKSLPLYERIVNAHANEIVVIPAEKTLNVKLREQDLSWENFLSDNENFKAISCDPEDHINILFSSGTTGEPKAIPWTQTTPIKCASDAYLHHNIQPGDVFCWPTNLGWMMGPWLIFACLINKATIALYDGTPNGKNFGEFIQDAKVNLLGVVPTLVKTWRNTASMENLDWRSIKLFTSTGERSNVDDMLYLMYLVDYCPIIEYCGGTEIGGAYVTSTIIQPSAPAAFSTPVLGLDFAIIDEKGKLTDNGEVALIPPSIGLSTALLKKNHHQVYYEDMPKLPDGKILRRHGDQIVRYPNGYYHLLGRIDDTMKLNGIKISSAEIEAVLNRLPTIYETAAIAINFPGEGPSQLIVYAITKSMKFDPMQLKSDMQNAIKQNLNPLFKIHDVVFVKELPRTASNKVMRRILRNDYNQMMNEKKNRE